MGGYTPTKNRTKENKVNLSFQCFLDFGIVDQKYHSLRASGVRDPAGCFLSNLFLTATCESGVFIPIFGSQIKVSERCLAHCVALKPSSLRTLSGDVKAAPFSGLSPSSPLLPGTSIAHPNHCGSLHLVSQLLLMLHLSFLHPPPVLCSLHPIGAIITNIRPIISPLC